MKTTHHVRFYFSGALMAETMTEHIKCRDPRAITIPTSADAFEFYDVIERTAKREDGKLLIDRETIRVSRRFYPGGAVFTLTKLKRRFPRETTLIATMEGNHWKRLVKTRCGKWQPFLKGDHIL